jgi:hypothetical protein
LAETVALVGRLFRTPGAVVVRADTRVMVAQAQGMVLSRPQRVQAVAAQVEVRQLQVSQVGVWGSQAKARTAR